MTSSNFSHVAAEITFNNTKNDQVKPKYCSNDQKIKEITLRQHTLITNLEDCILMKHCKKNQRESAEQPQITKEQLEISTSNET